MLGLRTVRTVDALNAAYRPLIRQWHPDRHQGKASYAAAVERATAINDAYAFLLATLQREQDSVPSSVSRAAASSTASGDGFPDPSVLEIFVKPSSIISVGYNSVTSDLFVKYIGHRIYRYRQVPPAVFEALLLAPSASSFVRDHVDRRFAHE